MKKKGHEKNPIIKTVSRFTAFISEIYLFIWVAVYWFVKNNIQEVIINIFTTNSKHKNEIKFLFLLMTIIVFDIFLSSNKILFTL